MQGPERAPLPTRAALHADGLYLAMRDIAPDELQDPFMQQTITRVARPETLVLVPGADVGKAPPTTAPAGLIFHVGRCGSTVITQALKQRGDVVVYSEPLPLNDLLTVQNWPRQTQVAAVRSLGAAFAAHAGAPYVIKLSSWSTLFCDVVAEAFPDTPWVFVIRDPIEVGAAIVNDPPPWFRGSFDAARLITTRVDPAGRANSSEDFYALLYAAFCDTILALDRKNGALVRYETLQDSLTEIIAPRFRLSPDEAKATRMRESMQHYAKAPVGAPTTFSPDAGAKQRNASADLRRAVETLTRPSLDRLLAAFAAR